MTTTITAGASQTVTLLQGYALDFTGTGVAVLGPGPQASLQYSINNSGRVGPFPRDQVVYLTATTALAFDSNQTILVGARIPLDAGDPVTGSPDGTALEVGDVTVFRSDCPPGFDNLPDPVQQMSTTAAISTTATVRLTPTGTYRKARVSWINNGASGAAKLNIAANCANDVEGLVASQSAKQRDVQMVMGDALLIVSPVPITSLNFSSDGAIVADTHRLVVTFGA